MADESVYNESGLLQRLAEGDEKSFRAIYDNFHKAIYFQAYNYLQSVQLAEDAVQEVFLKLWQKRENATEIKSLKNYLFIVARNCIISDLRKKVLNTNYDELTRIDTNEDPDILPDRQIDLKEAKKIVSDAIEALPPQQKTVFQLSREEGLGHKEIGVKMGISQNTVKSHMGAALRSIRQALESKSMDLGVLVFLFLMKK